MRRYLEVSTVVEVCLKGQGREVMNLCKNSSRSRVGIEFGAEHFLSPGVLDQGKGKDTICGDARRKVERFVLACLRSLFN